MEDNHLYLLRRNRLHWHGSRIFKYFDFDKINFVSERIKGLAKSAINNIEAKMRELKLSIKKSLEADWGGGGDMSVQIVKV